MTTIQPARYKPARDFAPSWRALCSWSSCGERVATMLIDIDDGESPAMHHTTRIAVRADFVAGAADGIWRAAKRPPRRPFVSSVAGHGSVGGGVPDARLVARELKVLPFSLIESPVVVQCPRCGALSVVRLADFDAERTQRQATASAT